MDRQQAFQEIKEQYQIAKNNGTLPELFQEYGLDADGNEIIQEINQEEENFVCEMATCKGGFESVKLAVYGSEGEGYPHFHFYQGLSPESGIPNKGQGGGCILFKDAKYFIHGTHRSTLERNEMKKLIPFLKQKHLIYNVQNWIYLITEWNTNNPYAYVDPLTPIPPYHIGMPSVRD